MGKRAYRIAYDGRAYHGFQRQPDQPTVERALFAGLAEAGIDFSDAPPGYAAAGRTDAGVSALAQTIAFEAPAWLSPRAFTARLPGDIHVWASTPVPEDFHATHDARCREYTYLLHVPDPDTERIAAIEKRVSGEHDFHNVAAEKTGTVRDLSVTSTQRGEFRHVRVLGGGFPRQLVRRLVALYDRVLRGEATLDFIDQVLRPAPLPGPDGIQPAPAYPLVLTGVEYDLPFDIDAHAAGEAADAFESRALTARTRAEVAARLERGIQEAGAETPSGDNP